MNIQNSAEEIGISLEAYRRLCRLFLDNTDQDISQLKEAVSRNDSKTISQLAHHIKGAASNMDFEQLSSRAKDLQSAADLEDGEISGRYRSVLDEYRRIKREMQEAL